jgi:hypothetical protein
MPEKSRLVASGAAAGERPAILRHQRHRLAQIAASNWFASVTQNARPFAACVTRCAFYVTNSSRCVGRTMFRD